MMWLTIVWSAFLLLGVFSQDVQEAHQETPKENLEETIRDRRDVIEEEKYYNIRTANRNNDNRNEPAPWLPGHLTPEDPTTKITITNNAHEALPFYQTTEVITDKPTGRGARASNENWVKLPFPDRDVPFTDRDELNRNELQPPKQSGDLINSRMPRVNFVTQNKPLEAAESRHDKESIQRSTRTDDLRTEFVRPEEDREQYKPVYPRQAVYYPEESRRPYYDDRYYASEDLYRRDPYYDLYDRRYNTGYGPRLDRYDEYDNYVPRKPKRIIYYAHLPDVVRTPPSVDLRYRYSADPYRREDDYYARTGRYDYRFRNRYPYAPLRKEERRFGYRDLAGAGTTKDKKVEEKVTPTPVLPQKEDKFKTEDNLNRDLNRNTINSHQYHDTGDNLYMNQASHKAFNHAVRADDNYLRFDSPLFHGTVEDPYQRKY